MNELIKNPFEAVVARIRANPLNALISLIIIVLSIVGLVLGQSTEFGRWTTIIRIGSVPLLFASSYFGFHQVFKTSGPQSMAFAQFKSFVEPVSTAIGIASEGDEKPTTIEVNSNSKNGPQITNVHEHAVKLRIFLPSNDSLREMSAGKALQQSRAKLEGLEDARIVIPNNRTLSQRKDFRVKLDTGWILVDAPDILYPLIISEDNDETPSEIPNNFLRRAFSGMTKKLNRSTAPMKDGRIERQNKKAVKEFSDKLVSFAEGSKHSNIIEFVRV